MAKKKKSGSKGKAKTSAKTASKKSASSSSSSSSSSSGSTSDRLLGMVGDLGKRFEELKKRTSEGAERAKEIAQEIRKNVIEPRIKAFRDSRKKR